MASDAWHCHCPLCWISTPPTFQCRGGASDGCNNVLAVLRTCCVLLEQRGGALGGSPNKQDGRVRGEGCSRSWGCSVVTLLRGHRTLWGGMECSAENRQAWDGRGVSASLGEDKAVWMKASWPYRSTNPPARSPCCQRVRRRARERFQLKMQETTADRNIRFEYWWGQSLAGSWPSRAGSMKSMDPTLRRL